MAYREHLLDGGDEPRLQAKLAAAIAEALPGVPRWGGSWDFNPCASVQWLPRMLEGTERALGCIPEPEEHCVGG